MKMRRMTSVAFQRRREGIQQPSVKIRGEKMIRQM